MSWVNWSLFVTQCFADPLPTVQRFGMCVPVDLTVLMRSLGLMLSKLKRGAHSKGN